MLKCSERANIYKGKIQIEELNCFLKHYDSIEQTNLFDLFKMIYVDNEKYTLFQISLKLNCDESTVRRHLKKVNKCIEILSNNNNIH